MSQVAEMLTKRRAVDFCHVATAICRRSAALVLLTRGTAFI